MPALLNVTVNEFVPLTSAASAGSPAFVSVALKKAKEARIGMDSNTVLLAMGQPNKRIRDKNASGEEQEDWLYVGRGQRQTFVTFEKDIVVSIRQY